MCVCKCLFLALGPHFRTHLRDKNLTFFHATSRNGLFETKYNVNVAYTFHASLHVLRAGQVCPAGYAGRAPLSSSTPLRSIFLYLLPNPSILLLGETKRGNPRLPNLAHLKNSTLRIQETRKNCTSTLSKFEVIC